MGVTSGDYGGFLGQVVGYEIVAVDKSKEGTESAKGNFTSMFTQVAVSAASTLFVFEQVMGYVGKIQEFANAAAEYNHQMELGAIRTGMTTDEMMRWNKVATMAEMDVSTLTLSISRLGIRLNDTTKAGQDNQALLRSWGIEVKNSDGSFRSMSEIFPQIINHLRSMKDTTQANIVSQELFGRSFSQLAPLFTLTETQMKSYYDTASVLSKEDQSRLSIYEMQVRKLDADMAGINRRIGIEFAGSMTAATSAFDKFITNFSNMGIWSYLDAALTRLILGFEYVVELATQASNPRNLLTGDIAPHMKEWVETWQKEYSEMMNSVKEETAKTVGGLYLPEPGAAASTTAAEVAAAAVAAIKPTYNSMFGSSIQEGGIGPDFSGYSDLANMSMDQLEAVAAGGLGKSKSMAEKAQQYLARMKAEGGQTTTLTGSAAGSIKAPDTVVMDQTANIQKAYITQGTALDDLVNKTLKQYVAWEDLAVTHYTAMAEVARIYMEKVVNDWYKSADAITAKVAYAQLINVVDGTAAANPIMPTVSPTLVLGNIDLSGVKLSGGGKSGGTTIVMQKGAVQVNTTGSTAVAKKTGDAIASYLGMVSDTNNVW